MTNLEYLKKIKKDSYMEHIEVKDFDCRKILALEIIAEQMIHLDNTLEAVVTTLENIETFIRGR